MSDLRSTTLEALLRERSPQTAAELATGLGVSQPTVSRALNASGGRVLAVGRARATRYVLTRDIARAGKAWPLHRIDPQGGQHRLGVLTALHGDGFHFAPAHPTPALLHDGFASGLLPGFPWFLDDQRPQGFLGRAFARRVAIDIGASPDLARWQSDDIVLALLRHGDDQVGDLVLGDDALQAAMQHALSPDTIDAGDRASKYAELADAVLRGEDVGSSAGGEQPKFAVVLDDGEALRSVIVKFSERDDTPTGRRWSDLLRCEHLASSVLREHGQPAASSAIVVSDRRTFLESTRFDRTPAMGRHGFVSLGAIDAVFHGHGRIDWWRYARQLQREGWIVAGDAVRLGVLGWFGALIGNTDMHLGNAGLILADVRPFALAPAYDMLPMAFRPASTGEIVERQYVVTLPTPEFREEWRQAAPLAREFWRRVSMADSISPGFRDIADGAGTALERAMERHA